MAAIRQQRNDSSQALGAASCKKRGFIVLYGQHKYCNHNYSVHGLEVELSKGNGLCRKKNQ